MNDYEPRNNAGVRKRGANQVNPERSIPATRFLFPRYLYNYRLNQTTSPFILITIPFFVRLFVTFKFFPFLLVHLKPVTVRVSRSGRNLKVQTRYCHTFDITPCRSTSTDVASSCPSRPTPQSPASVVEATHY